MPETSEPTDLTVLAGGIRAADLMLSKEAADALKADAISLREMAQQGRCPMSVGAQACR